MSERSHRLLKSSAALPKLTKGVVDEIILPNKVWCCPNSITTTAYIIAAAVAVCACLGHSSAAINRILESTCDTTQITGHQNKIFVVDCL